MQQSPGQELARVIRAPSLGRAWLATTRAIVAEGRAVSYEGSAISELALVDLVVDDPSAADGLIERFGDPDRISWMKDNFSDRHEVAELGGAASYATRLYDYEASGRDQVAWATEKLRADPGSRSAVITTLQPLSDTTYIPCVSLLQFWMPAAKLELIATAHSIDFGMKGYANLVELAAIQRGVARALGVGVGLLLFRISSAHVYERDLGTVRDMLAASKGT
jgi:thymidylate synthase